MKSFETNGHRITCNNIINFVGRDDYFGRHPLRDYLCYLEGVEGYPLQLDHWSADYSMHSYQVGGVWITIYRNEVEIVKGWLQEVGVNGFYEDD